MQLIASFCYFRDPKLTKFIKGGVKTPLDKFCPSRLPLVHFLKTHRLAPVELSLRLALEAPKSPFTLPGLLLAFSTFFAEFQGKGFRPHLHYLQRHFQCCQDPVPPDSHLDRLRPQILSAIDIGAKIRLPRIVPFWLVA
ncbi:hypothetical protein AMTR_s00137p00111590 [Amborella trichopoda]|uniref:Uncharacterized protein n=1 Tax=Amborella trichopoda TaxID=13333 RepID=W1NEV2_AMBTC|nr:hypothetical protein AMTR_s00137p00111590 [Amborella trichopoda]